MSDGAKNGDTVRVNYTGKLDSGEVFDSSEVSGEPLEFTVGADQVITGFDEAVRGMRVGERKTVKIPADEAYGPRAEQLISEVPRAGVNFGAEPEVGMNLVMQLPDGNQIPVSITDVTDTHVTLDANHPLAGENLTFEVELVENKSGGGAQS